MNAPQDFRAMTADTVGKDLLNALVLELKLLPDVWPKLSEKKQNDVIDRLRARVQSNIAMAVHTLASSGRTVVAGDLDQITIKDGVKAVIKFSAAAPSLHELYDAQSKAVLVVVASADDHTGGMDEVRGESDQRAMDLGKEYTAEDGEGMNGPTGDRRRREADRAPAAAGGDRRRRGGRVSRRRRRQAAERLPGDGRCAVYRLGEGLEAVARRAEGRHQEEGR
jgi:hypothetical protein